MHFTNDSDHSHITIAHFSHIGEEGEEDDNDDDFFLLDNLEQYQKMMGKYGEQIAEKWQHKPITINPTKNLKIIKSKEKLFGFTFLEEQQP